MIRKKVLTTAVVGALAVMSQSAISQVTTNETANPAYTQGTFGGQLYKGPSSSDTPYVQGVVGYDITSILTTGNTIGGYTMGGIPDGLGAYDNGNGTFTVLMNHEWALPNIGASHGVLGAGSAYVSQWVIDKTSLQVLSGGNLIQSVSTWNTGTQSYNSALTAAAGNSISFSRFCSADLSPVSAYSYTDTSTGTVYGTTARIFMHGEESTSSGGLGRQLATVVGSGATYELGKFNLTTNGSGATGLGSWENALANPTSQLKTVVIGNNDGGTGIMNNSLAVYVGTKQTTGNEVDKAGLSNGTLKFVNVTGNPAEIVNGTTRATNITSGTTFTLSATASTTFSRPEDGAWNPQNAKQYYFVTTDQLNTVGEGGTQVGRSRLWRLTFNDISNPDLGGTIDMLLDGSEGQNMFDNMTVNADGTLTLLEDTGNAAHNGKMWRFDPVSGKLTMIARSDPARFGNFGLAATAPFNQDEETSGVIDITDILGRNDGNMYSMFVMQAHQLTGNSATVEGGQLMIAAVPEPETYAMMLAGLGLLGFARRRKNQK